MDPGLAFGKVFRQVRIDARLTQEQVAHATGLHRTFIGLLERGERQPTVRVVFKLAAALSTTPGELMVLTEKLAASE